MRQELQCTTNSYLVELTRQTALSNQAALTELRKLIDWLRHNDFSKHIFDSRDGEIFALVQSAMKNMNLGWNDQAADCLADAIKCRQRFSLSYVSLALLLQTLAYVLGKVQGKRAQRIEALIEAERQYKAEIAQLGRNYKETREQLKQALAEQQRPSA